MARSEPALTALAGAMMRLAMAVAAEMAWRWLRPSAAAKPGPWHPQSSSHSIDRHNSPAQSASMAAVSGQSLVRGTSWTSLTVVTGRSKVDLPRHTAHGEQFAHGLARRRCRSRFRRLQLNKRSTAAGSRSIRLSNTSAGPRGCRSPTSQWRSVATEKPKRVANSACVRPIRARNPATSIAAGRKTFTPACRPRA